MSMHMAAGLGKRPTGSGAGAKREAGGIREVGDGEKGVLVEDFAVKEPLQEVPRHWCLQAIGTQRLVV